jgi:TPR repeat protein
MEKRRQIKDYTIKANDGDIGARYLLACLYMDIGFNDDALLNFDQCINEGYKGSLRKMGDLLNDNINIQYIISYSKHEPYDDRLADIFYKRIELLEHWPMYDYKEFAEDAMRLQQKLIDQGDLKAMYRLWILHHKCQIDANDDVNDDLIKKSASLGCAQAQFMLGASLFNETNEYKDDIERWLILSAEQKNVNGICALAQFYYSCGYKTDKIYLLVKQALKMNVLDNKNREKIYNMITMIYASELHVLGSFSCCDYPCHFDKAILGSLSVKELFNTVYTIKMLNKIDNNTGALRLCEKYVEFGEVDDELNGLCYCNQLNCNCVCTHTQVNIQDLIRIYCDNQTNIIQKMKATLYNTSLYVADIHDIIEEYIIFVW